MSNSNINIRDYICILIFVLTSGVKIWLGILTPAFCFLLFATYSFIYKFVFHTKRKENNKSVIFIFVIVLIMLLGDIYYNRSYQTNSSMGYVVTLLGSYFVISSLNFYIFRRILLDIIFIIVLMGIPLFFLNELNILPTTTIQLEGKNLYTVFGPYIYGWPSEFHRFAGIWHEPGACQIILNTVLYLHLDKFINLDFTKKEILKFTVIIIGLIISFSTGGYLVFALFIIIVGFNIKLSAQYKHLLYIIAILTMVAVLLVLFNSDVIQDKIFNNDNASRSARLDDIYAFLSMIYNRPILGYGLGTEEFWKVSTSLGNTANSSGLLCYVASLGMIYFIMWSFYLYKCISKMKHKIVNTIFIFFAFIILQSNECYIEFPISNIMIFPFGSYNFFKY